MPDNPNYQTFWELGSLLVTGRLKELRNPFADSLCQREPRWWDLVQEHAVLLINLCVVVVESFAEVFDFGLHLLDLCSGGLDIGVVPV